MINKDNLKFFIHGLSKKEKVKIKNSVKEFIIIELHIFNVESFFTFKLKNNISDKKAKKLNSKGNVLFIREEFIYNYLI